MDSKVKALVSMIRELVMVNMIRVQVGAEHDGRLHQLMRSQLAKIKEKYS